MSGFQQPIFGYQQAYGANAQTPFGFQQGAGVQPQQQPRVFQAPDGSFMTVDGWRLSPDGQWRDAAGKSAQEYAMGMQPPALAQPVPGPDLNAPAKDTFSAPASTVIATPSQKFSILKATGATLKGALYDPIRSIFTLSGLATMAGAYGLVKLTKGFALLPLLALGTIVGGYQTLKGLIGGLMAAVSGNSQAAYDQFRGMGNGLSNAALSLFGAKTAMTSPKGIGLKTSEGASAAQEIAGAEGWFSKLTKTGEHLLSALTGDSTVTQNGHNTGMSIWQASQDGLAESWAARPWGDTPARLKTFNEARVSGAGENKTWATQAQKEYLKTTQRQTTASNLLKEDGPLQTQINSANSTLTGKEGAALSETQIQLEKLNYRKALLEAHAEYSDPVEHFEAVLNATNNHVAELKQLSPEGTPPAPALAKAEAQLAKLLNHVQETDGLSPETVQKVSQHRTAKLEAALKEQLKPTEGQSVEDAFSAIEEHGESLTGLYKNYQAAQALGQKAQAESGFWGGLQAFLKSPALDADVVLQSMLAPTPQEFKDAKTIAAATSPPLPQAASA